MAKIMVRSEHRKIPFIFAAECTNWPISLEMCAILDLDGWDQSINFDWMDVDDFWITYFIFS